MSTLEALIIIAGYNADPSRFYNTHRLLAYDMLCEANSVVSEDAEEFVSMRAALLDGD